MILKIFTQPNCPKCPPAKALGKEIERLDTPGVGAALSRSGGKKLKIEYFDTSSVDGLAEASFYSVMSTPSLVLCDDQGKEIRSWRGKIPQFNEIKNLLK